MHSLHLCGSNRIYKWLYKIVAMRMVLEGQSGRVSWKHNDFALQFFPVNEIFHEKYFWVCIFPVSCFRQRFLIFLFP